LCDRGFVLLCQNYRIRGGEIDLIGMDGKTLCFVEVRFREKSILGHPVETISAKKQAAMMKTAEHFLAHAWKNPPCACRFDVVTMEGTPSKIVWLQDAFSLVSF